MYRELDGKFDSILLIGSFNEVFCSLEDKVDGTQLRVSAFLSFLKTLN